MTNTVTDLSTGDLTSVKQDPSYGWVGYTMSNTHGIGSIYPYRWRSFDGNGWSDYYVGLGSTVDSGILPVNMRGAFLDGVSELDMEVEISTLGDFSGSIHLDTASGQSNWYYWNGAAIVDFTSPLLTVFQDPSFGWVGYAHLTASAGTSYYVRYRPVGSYIWSANVLRCPGSGSKIYPVNLLGGAAGAVCEIDVSTAANFSPYSHYASNSNGTWEYFNGSTFQSFSGTLPSNSTCVVFWHTGVAGEVYYSRHRCGGSNWSIEKYQVYGS